MRFRKYAVVGSQIYSWEETIQPMNLDKILGDTRMNDEKKQPSLKEFLIALAAERPELLKKSGAKVMYEEAVAAGYNCSVGSIHTIRYMEKLTAGYDTPRKRVRARNRAYKLRKDADLRHSAKKKREEERAETIEKTFKPKKKVTTHPGSSAAPASYSEHDRDFMSALRRIGLGRGRELIELAAFLEVVS